MRHRTMLLVSLLASVTLSARAGEKSANNDLDRPISLGELNPTPEMWFYQQEKKLYDNPRVAVRQKAEYRAAQRQLRLAARRWYGIDNSRPTTINTPFQGGTFGPSFAGGRDPNRWPNGGGPLVIVSPRRDGYRGTW
jgi:hypothetical protein